METIVYQDVKVHIGALFSNLPRYYEKDATQVILLIDENVYKNWEPLFEKYVFIVIPSGENQKSISIIETIIGQLLAKGVNRKTLLIGVGGGVVSDITGFVASILMRGVDFALVPTTLLAMVDAAIGGKNGINMEQGKNLIGAIKQPLFILCDIGFLDTLPQVEIINGMAEVIKHACIKNERYFGFIQEHIQSILSLKQDVLFRIIKESVKIKCSIVEQDPYEINSRKILNYGHTYGHAFEKFLNIPHGQAVSLGIIAINKLAVTMGRLSVIDSNRIRELLSDTGLPTAYETGLDPHLNKYIQMDKKKTKETIDLIFVTQIGKSEIVTLPISDIAEVSKLNIYD